MPNILPSNFTASTTDFMVWIFGQISTPFALVMAVIAVGAIAGMIIHHFKK